MRKRVAMGPLMLASSVTIATSPPATDVAPHARLRPAATALQSAQRPAMMETALMVMAAIPTVRSQAAVTEFRPAANSVTMGI
jgi:hypothetical protein